VPVSYWSEYAWLGRTMENVLLEVADGRFAAVTPGVTAPPPGARVLRGLTLPGLANVHSHAFHRALRGRTHAGRGTFWTWRDRMYDVAGRLDPDTYLALARATYAEMALAGVTAVGEFHYLHHTPDGTAYDDPNAMGHALLQAAAEAGLRISLLDTLYLTSTVDGDAPVGPQRPVLRRLGRELGRAGGRPQSPPHAVIGAAAHSVRAVPAAKLAETDILSGGTARPRAPVRAAGRERDLPGPLRPHPDRGARRRRPAGPRTRRRCTRPTSRPGT
jgi:formiminoglutamate deiminase